MPLPVSNQLVDGEYFEAVALREARAAVDAAKVKLGERGPVWWTDGAKDFNRHLVKNTPYAGGYASVEDKD